MTVRELIDILKRHPDDLRVVLDGYEGGCEDVSEGQIRRVKIALNVNEESYYGNHEESDLVIPPKSPPPEVVDALVLRRTSW